MDGLHHPSYVRVVAGDWRQPAALRDLAIRGGHTRVRLLPVAVELALLARFYERFGDHCVNLARRQVGRNGPD